MEDKKLDIKAYLDADEKKDLLRLLTAGSVDDGKSTLIGRLLFDSKKLYEDQLQALERDSKRVGNAGAGQIDYALLLDGLKAEREEGITIDVAYRYFSTNQRKFIIADTPGHEQYTRNMITGGSTANLAIILVDARTGVITQTRRHTFLVSLLGIKHIVLAVNKPVGVVCTTSRDDPANIVDYVGYPERVYPVGRLDKNSEGLILMTNQGEWMDAILRSSHYHEKEYIVSVDKPLSPEFKAQMEGGLPILGQTTLPCEVEILGSRRFRIILHQGLNRQIRRMCEYLGYRVVKLRRVRFMNIELGDMKPGEIRRLTPVEVKGLVGSA